MLLYNQVWKMLKGQKGEPLEIESPDNCNHEIFLST